MWQPAFAGAEVPVDATSDDLRHTFASTALAEGMPISEVSRWLDHKPITTTVDLYGTWSRGKRSRTRRARQGILPTTMMCPQSAPAAR
jgi:integrase